MPLESLHHLNIKRMSLESPERVPELPFDPERDITEEDWQAMTTRLERHRTNNAYGNFAWQASRMTVLTHILSPKQKEQSFKREIPPLPEVRKF